MKTLALITILAVLPISQKGIDLIYNYEIGGGRNYYNKYLIVPEVPAWRDTASGVTLGIGFDSGFSTKAEIQQAFEGVLSQDKIDILKSVSGMKGKNAYYNGLPKVKYNIRLSFDNAEKVFKSYTLPKFSDQTSNAFGLTDYRLSADCNGALVSLVYNRGPSLVGDSRREMRAIRTHVFNSDDSLIPAEIKSMKRLWSYSKLKGLHLRRDDEAKLFQDGLK